MSARTDEPYLSRKDRGAYYTTRAAAAALSTWALRSGAEEVLDPSAGEGVFLVAAANRLAALGGDPRQIHGVELDPATHATATARAAAVGVPAENVRRADFFASDQGPRFDVVIGNPPFIRFQRFRGASRRRALRRTAEAGVDLSPLASSWAPFVVHAAHALRSGGRMTFLVPHEIGQARYSRDVLSFLAASFERVTFVAPAERLFPGIDQDVIVLLAEGRGRTGGALRFASAADLSELDRAAATATPVDLDTLVAGRRLRFWGLPDDARTAYERLIEHPGITELGEVASVSSGYVTGANAFFHLAPDEAERLGLDRRDLVPAVFRSAALGGPVFGREDWEAAAAAGSAGYLFQAAEPDAPVARAYLDRGRANGVDRAYKTRTRAVWHRVPRVHQPDLLLAAMAAEGHALAINRAGVAPANTLHAVDLISTEHDDGSAPADRATALTLAWLTSASWLSRELEGRVLGGGMLKLEPGEAGRILVPWPSPWDPDRLRSAAPSIAARLRERGADAARELADTLILKGELGWTPREIGALAAAASTLRERRRRRPAR